MAAYTHLLIPSGLKLQPLLFETLYYFIFSFDERYSPFTLVKSNLAN